MSQSSSLDENGFLCLSRGSMKEREQCINPHFKTQEPFSSSHCSLLENKTPYLGLNPKWPWKLVQKASYSLIRGTWGPIKLIKEARNISHLFAQSVCGNTYIYTSFDVWITRTQFNLQPVFGRDLLLHQFYTRKELQQRLNDLPEQNNKSVDNLLEDRNIDVKYLYSKWCYVEIWKMGSATDPI